MESIKVRQRVGQDGILHLDLPIGLTAQDVDVMVIYQPAQTLEASEKQSLEQLYGVCADDPIKVDDQGVSAFLDDDLAGVFE